MIVGVRPALPLDGVVMILDNDICGSRVWADGPPPAIVVPEPLVSSGPDINQAEFPDVFAACAVTRAQSKSAVKVDTQEQHDVMCPDVPWSVSHSELVKEQEADGSLGVLLEMALPVGEVKKPCSVPQWDNFVGDLV